MNTLLSITVSALQDCMHISKDDERITIRLYNVDIIYIESVHFSVYTRLYSLAVCVSYSTHDLKMKKWMENIIKKFSLMVC